MKWWEDSLALISLPALLSSSVKELEISLPDLPIKPPALSNYLNSPLPFANWDLVIVCWKKPIYKSQAHVIFYQDLLESIPILFYSHFLTF